MSDWDAPTGNWDSRQEPDETGRPDEQVHQQGEQVGGYREQFGGGGLRAGRRGPGYQQAQGYGEATTDYRPGQESGYPPPPGYGSPPGHGPAPGQEPGSASRPGGGQLVRYGQPPADEPAFGSEPPGAIPQREAGTAPGYRQAGYRQAGYPQQGYGQDYRAQDFGQQDFGRQGSGRQAPGSGSFAPGDFGNQAGQSRAERDYRTEGYPQPGSGPAGFPRDGYGDDDQDEYAQDEYGLDQAGVTQAYGTEPGYGQHGYGQGGYAQDGYAQDGYGQGVYGHDGYRQDGYAQDGYAQDGYAQDGYAQDGYAQGFGGRDGAGFDAGDGGPGPRFRAGQRPAQRPGNVRMVLYLGAAVLGVVAIVFLVTRLTKSGADTAGGSSTPTGSATATARGPVSYVLTQAPKVGKFPLNKTVTSELATAIGNRSAPVAASIKAAGAGKPGKVVTGVYDLGPVSSIASGAYKGVTFTGYDGTFNPAAAIRVVRSHLAHSRVVNPGKHGGDMVCGYNTSSGADTSECAWVTRTTFGVVQFLEGQNLVKYDGAAKIAVKVRDAVEVAAS